MVDDDPAKNAALEQLKPLLKPEKMQEAGQVLTRFAMRVVSKTHSGPIPSADEMEHLERVQPGMANRCMEMAEREQLHRHGIENKVVQTEASLRSRGQPYALVALLILIIAVIALGWMGFGTAAAALGSATIVGVVAVFATGRYYDTIEDKSSPDASPPESKSKVPAQRKPKR